MLGFPAIIIFGLGFEVNGQHRLGTRGSVMPEVFLKHASAGFFRILYTTVNFVMLSRVVHVKCTSEITGAICSRQKFPKLADFSHLDHKFPIPNSAYPPQPSVIYGLGILPKSSALPAVGIEPILAKSNLSSFWTF